MSVKGKIRKLGNTLADYTDAGKIRDFSLTQARQYAENNNIPKGDTEADALQHMTMSILMNKTYGELPTEAVQYLYEKLTPNAGKREEAMDFHNNAVGQKLYKSLPEEKQESLSYEEAFELATKHLEAHKKGEVQDETLQPVYYGGLVREQNPETGEFEPTGVEKVSDKFSGKMEAKMACGGLMVDPLEEMSGVIVGIEETSGNAIPAGALPEEVADDVPAMLSEGEYVVPADVLRWHGIKYMENLRHEAKMGLAMMQEEGRFSTETYDMDEYEDDVEPEDKENEEDDLIPSSGVKVQKAKYKVIDMKSNKK